MKKRFLAILLCLSVLLMACACAAETEPPIASHPEHQESSPQFTLSEVNAESSKTEEPTPYADPSGEIPPIETSDESLTVEESDVVIEPIQPIVPEEKETTLEKVLSFDIGIDGLMEYNFLFYDDPSTADIIVYGDAYTDGNGVFYQAADSEIIRVNDGAKFPFISWSQVFDIEVRQNDFYILKAGETGSYGILYHYDISTGFETPTLIAQYDNLPSGSLGFAGGVPVILEQGNVYSVEGRRLSKSKAPFAIEESKDSSVSVQKQNDVLTIQQGENFYCYVPALSDTGTFVAETKDWDGNWIYSYYDQNGSIKTKFLYTTQYPGSTISCEVDFTWGKEIYTVDLYTPYCATLGGNFFEGLVDGKVFFDVYGNAYYAAYYLDHCDIYKIDQGYSDIQFPVDEKLQAGDSSIAPTSSASGSSASSNRYLSIGKDKVNSNALAMINLRWEILPGNLTIRKYDDGSNRDLELPKYLEGKADYSWQTGIPYCKAGNNGAVGDYDFKTERARLLSDAENDRQMTGNISDVTSHQENTVGLDCMRFVGKALELTDPNGLAPWEFKARLEAGLGHEVNSAADLKFLDIIISSRHAMLFWKVEGGKVWVYDTTSTVDEAKTNKRNTGFTITTLDNYKSGTVTYKFYHIYSASGYNSTQHWTGCASCEEYRTYEDHTFTYTSISGTQHTKTCTGCGYSATESHGGPCIAISATQHVKPCMACGHSVTESHAFSYTQTSGGHIATCTGCSYSVTATHGMSLSSYVPTGHIYSCTCGYSTREAHTLSYAYDIDHHWRECSVCDYETMPADHIFVNDYCRVCNAPYIGSGPANIIVIPPEEDELLPVPEDQKAFL